MAKGTKVKAAAPKRKAPPSPAGVSDPQSGGAQIASDDVSGRKKAAAEQFSEADAVAEATLGRQIRGW